MDSLMLALKAVGETADPNGEFEAILSTPDMDREGEVVMAGAFDPLPETVPVFRSHGWTRGEEPIGIATPSYEGEHLMLKGRWAGTPEAQTTRKLVEGGFIKTMSAGFLTKLRDASNRKAILKAELLEGSTAPIPVNSKALILAAKSLAALEGSSVKAGARNSASDMEHIQSAHDHMAALGASCSATKAMSVKAIVGTVEALQARVCDALEDAYGDYATYLRGVDPTGTVYFDWYAGDGDTYQQDFTDDGAVVTLTGEPVEVDVHEIVVPDADREVDDTPVMQMTTLSLSADAAGAAAEQAAAPAVEATEDVLDDLVKGIDLLVDAFAD